MKNLFMPSSGGPFMEWLTFAIFLLLICLGIGGFFVWMKMTHTSKGKRKRKKRHHRHFNPTLAQTGGLPPKRDPDQPPPGP